MVAIVDDGSQLILLRCPNDTQVASVNANAAKAHTRGSRYISGPSRQWILLPESQYFGTITTRAIHSTSHENANGRALYLHRSRHALP